MARMAREKYVVRLPDRKDPTGYVSGVGGAEHHLPTLRESFRV